jgi:signal transduction histidine kinase
VRQIIRTLVAYVIVGVFAAALYVVSITALLFGFQQTFGLNYWVAFAITLAIVAVILHPLVQVVQGIVLSRASGIGYDTAQAVREYSASISNILNIELLAKKVTSLIQDTMNARSVRLYLVDNTRVDGKNIVRLRPVQPVEGSVLFERLLSADNPMVTYLAAEARPLTQYDIDLLPRYKQMPPAERAWLAGLGMDMYVPIHSRGQWIGLLTLGPKATGDRYFKDDMALLDTLADQTAIALENARLVTDLVSLNRDLKRAYADLEKAHSQLNELDRLKSAFIGAITHELRTPIANIQFSIQLIDKYGTDNLLPDQQEQMRQLETAATHAKIMVDNLVNFATFLGKQGELKLAEFSFSELLGETIVMLEPHARRKDIVLRSDVADEGLPPINGDRARLGDAIYHLMQNGIKFTGPEGVVTARCWPKDDRFYFTVTDTGIGVPPDKLAGLWEGFEQMADPLKRGLEGLGLGLALVKYVVIAHDGEVTAESVEGEGSTFGFHIPIGGPAPRTTLNEEIITPQSNSAPQIPESQSLISSL